MRQAFSGWLTILPSGRWYLRPGSKTRIPSLTGKRKTVLAQLGPYFSKKTVTIGKAPLNSDSIRTKIRCKYAHNTLTLGPIIGILTAGNGKTFMGNRENFKDIFLSGKRLGALVYVFTPSGINWSKKYIIGFLYNVKKESWTEHILPFPNVIYNRIPTRKLEQQPATREVLSRLCTLDNVTLFNRRFFNKYRLFSILEETKQIQHLLPETKKLDSFHRLKALADRHPILYLKPVLGKAGEGIMRLERKESHWRLRQVRNQRADTRTFSSLEKVWRYIRKRVRQRRYLIQQGIPLARYQGRPFDVRVLVQKNGAGNWSVTGIGIRRAGANSITTHVPRGGSIHSTEKVLPHLFQERAEEVLSKIHETALTIAHVLAEKVDHLAEMSMDLGLTAEGELWFFEANAKPEKFDEPKIRRTSLNNIIWYSQFASQMKAPAHNEIAV